MRRPTRKETIFLAITATTASLGIIEVIPKVISLCEKKVAIVESELKSKKSMAYRPASYDSKDAFSTGLVMGLVIGTLGTTKIIADKINIP